MVEPNVPYFRGGNWYANAALHALDLGDEVLDVLALVEGLVAVDRLVADDDAVDIPVVSRERDRAFDLLLVLLFPFVEPDAERDAQAVFGGKHRHEVQAIADA